MDVVDGDAASNAKEDHRVHVPTRLVCTECGRTGFRGRDALANHIRCRHVGPGMLEALSGLMPPAHAACARLLGDTLSVAWEDDWLAVVVKPQGVKTNGRGMSLASADWLLGQLRPSASWDALRLPCPVHRLDAGTGGLVVFAKTRWSLEAVSDALAQRRVKKRYRALVHGRLEGEGLCEEPMDGRAASTRYKVTEPPVELASGWVSTVDLWPLTGRRHQLRKHLASLGHPIVGDWRYGDRTNEEDSDGSDAETSQSFRTFHLWSLEVQFPHPARAASCDSTQTELDVRMTGDQWAALCQSIWRPPQKAKKKRVPSNIVGQEILQVSGLSVVQPGDLVVGVDGGVVTPDQLETSTLERVEVMVSLTRSAAWVDAKIEEPESFRALRADKEK